MLSTFARGHCLYSLVFQSRWFKSHFRMIAIIEVSFHWKRLAWLLQDPNSEITIAEYRLPEAKAGTGFYFDFPRLVQTRRIIFKLLGDVAAFSDDPAEQDDSGFRVVGLSLSNRIKLYYYADPYELGKWASLSAVWLMLGCCSYCKGKRKGKKGFCDWLCYLIPFFVLMPICNPIFFYLIIPH